MSRNKMIAYGLFLLTLAYLVFASFAHAFVTHDTQVTSSESEGIQHIRETGNHYFTKFIGYDLVIPPNVQAIALICTPIDLSVVFPVDAVVRSPSDLEKVISTCPERNHKIYTFTTSTTETARVVNAHLLEGPLVMVSTIGHPFVVAVERSSMPYGEFALQLLTRPVVYFSLVILFLLILVIAQSEGKTPDKV